MSSTAVNTESPSLDASFWRESLAPYTKPRTSRATLDILTSVFPYLGLTAVMYLLASSGHYPWALLLAIPTAGFLTRTFIVFHDCTHSAFSRNRKLNKWVGIITGILTLSVFHQWRHQHAVHHATSGDLDHRGTGDVHTLTVKEYYALPLKERLKYRLFRNPLVMLGLGPLWAMVINPRIPKEPRFRKEVLLTDLALLAVFIMLLQFFSLGEVLVVQLVPIMIAGAVGIWLFYAQHQFEDAYWEAHEDWDYVTSALRGASFLDLPQPLRFFTGNIGYHHVHHLASRIPNYNLPRAHHDHEIFKTVPRLTLADGLRALRLKLYDEDSKRLVGWSGGPGRKEPLDF